MTEIQVTRWRDLPSMVMARDGADTVRVALPQRFQDAIDEAAMRLGETDADAYLAGWVRDPWTRSEGTTAEAAEAVAVALESEWPPERINDLLETYVRGHEDPAGSD